MKKIMIPILIALIIGSTFGFFLFKNIDENIEAAFFGTKELTIFQAGVFLNEDNANNFASNFKNALVYKDDDFFRVYLAVLNDSSSIKIMEEFFEQNNINYYLRTITIRENNFTKELQKYETLLLNATQDSTYDMVNERILKLYKELVI